MKVQVMMIVDLEELDVCELDGVVIDENNLSEIIGDFYTAKELTEIIGEKLKEEEDSGNWETEYYLTN